MYSAKEVIKKMRRMDFTAQKESKELSNKILVQKGGKSLNKLKTRKRHRISSSSQSRFHLDKERRKVRNQVKRSEGGDLLVPLRLHHLLIPRALTVRKKTKKPKGSILYRMKINLNGTFHLSLHLMQTHSLSTTQSVKHIQYQTT